MIHVIEGEKSFVMSVSSSNPQHFGHVVCSLHPHGVFKARFPRWWFHIFYMFTPTCGNDPV